MATPLRVPGQYEGGFAKIRDLSDESAQELLAALQQAPDNYNGDSLSLAVAEMVDTIAASDVREIVLALLSLYSYRDYSQEAISEVAAAIAQAMEESRSEQFRLHTDERPHFEERLAQLLGIGSLNVTVRAGRLSIENAHPLQDVRIVTDVRPVFEPDAVEATPKGAIVLHQLKLTYWANSSSDTENFFITLDANDVRKLLDQLERASSKAASLKAVLKAAQVPYIDSE